MRPYLFTLLAALSAILGTTSAEGQARPITVERENPQVSFPQTVPAGNYSGITALGSDDYAVVSDKSSHGGFFVFHITVNPVTGQIKSVENKGFRDSAMPNRDQEGIAFLPQQQTIVISGEADNAIKEYNLDGKPTMRQAEVPPVFSKARPNYSLESLSYNPKTKLLWTCNESTLNGDGEAATSVNGVRNRIRIQSFDSALQPLQQYAYLMDAPEATQATDLYGMGVSELTALDDGSLLVLEREFFTPPMRLGAFVSNKIYRVFPKSSTAVDPAAPLTDNSPWMKKELLTSWHTHLRLFNHSIANYEGMCLGPKLENGAQVLLLVSDSQDQYAGVMQDWFKSIVISMK